MPSRKGQVGDVYFEQELGNNRVCPNSWSKAGLDHLFQVLKSFFFNFLSAAWKDGYFQRM